MRGHPFRIAGLAALGVVVVAAVSAAALYLWLRSYAPLATAANGGFAPGPGVAQIVRPARGSAGKPVFFPRYRAGRDFDTAFTVRNGGRFAVTVTGVAPRAGGALTPIELLGTDSSTASAEPGHLHSFAPLRLERGDAAILVVRWRLTCSTTSATASADAVPLRYTYLSLFTRTETVRLPFAVALRCKR